MHLKVMSPQQVTFDADVSEIIALTTQGQIAILPHHIDIVTQLEAGEMIVKTGKSEQILAVAGGFLEVQKDEVTVLADHSIRVEDIQIEKAEAAQKRAEEILKKSREDVSERDFVTAQTDMRRSLLQLKVVRKRRNHIGQ